MRLFEFKTPNDLKAFIESRRTPEKVVSALTEMKAGHETMEADQMRRKYRDWLKLFVEMAKESRNYRDFYQKAVQHKNVPSEFSELFHQAYAGLGMSMQDSVEEFLADVQAGHYDDV